MSMVRKDFLREEESLKKENGQIIANPKLIGVTPYIAALDEVSGANSISLSGNGQGTRMISNGYNGILDLYNLSFSATSPEFTVFIRNTSKGREYMNRAIHGDTILGTGLLPFVLSTPFILEPSSAINIDFVDLSGASNEIYLSFTGNMYQNNSGRSGKMFSDQNKDSLATVTPYFYGFDSGYVQLSANGTATGTITIQGNTDFFLERIMQKSTGSFNIEIQDSASAVRWTSGRSVRSSALFGDGEDNWLFFPQKFIPRSTQILFTITDTSGSQNDIYLTLAGRHYYEQGPVSH